MKILNVLNPDTLLPYSCDEERRARQAVTGELGSGLNVLCPVTGEQKGRVVCMFRPHEYCPYCVHRNFDLFFEPDSKYEMVACPRWKNDAERMKGELPETYVFSEGATCKLQPFPFCSSCPASEELGIMHCDKAVPGWYSRWSRITKALRKEEEDG